MGEDPLCACSGLEPISIDEPVEGIEEEEESRRERALRGETEAGESDSKYKYKFVMGLGG